MAISSKNYVDISTTFPITGASSRAFGGLIFVSDEIVVSNLPEAPSGSASASGSSETSYTAEEQYAIHLNKLADDFNDGLVIDITKEEVKILFGVDSAVDKFANGYYSYISPSGRFASTLKCAKYTWTPKPWASVDLERDFSNVCAQTNNFGSFTFIPPQGVVTTSKSQEKITKKDYFDLADTSSLTSADEWNVFYSQLVKIAKVNEALDTKFLFVCNYLSQGNALNLDSCIERCGDLKDVKGTTFLYGGTEASAYMPMAILASTDYTNGTVVNFMFKQFSSEDPYVVVSDDGTYRTCNKSNINFYGKAQTNGQTFNFYQRGFNTDSTDTAIYCNEMWFKAECETQLFNELISTERLSADLVGVATVKTIVMEVGSGAADNGTFMPKTADSGDTRAIREIINRVGASETDVSSIVADIATVGYSAYAYLTPHVVADNLGVSPEPTIAYYVFYGTADSIRFIKGNNILI